MVALENYGVGVRLQLSDRLQRIEDGQDLLVELVITKNIEHDEESVRVKAVDQLCKEIYKNKHVSEIKELAI